MARKLTMLDFFAGAGGWSEGFRQQGFTIVQGVDHWRPSVETHNLNHGLQDKPTDVLDYENCPMEKIDADFSDVDVIVGSPPCVSFSMSNKAGKADKSLGIRLIESYLRIVAYKKWKKGSTLIAWYMENVPNSKNYTKETYTFRDLRLDELAKIIRMSPNDVALTVRSNGDVLCAAEYGSPQSRERFVCGEWVKTGKFLAPEKTHTGGAVTLGSILGKLPSPASKRSTRLCVDPNYPELKLPLAAISDHFYDSGIYEVEWENSRAAKVNHPFMGRMSFPEDLNRPSRTIMATQSASTREALIYPSAFSGRKGDGEYRMPTIREAASLMGFPITYQFYGSEGTKWRQIGNAVCPHLSSAVAKAVRKELGLSKYKTTFPKVPRVNDLNTFAEATFDEPPRKKSDAKFRRQPFKFGGIAVALVNYDVTGHSKQWTAGKKWSAAIFLGSGKEFSAVLPTVRHIARVTRDIAELTDGRAFMNEFEKMFKNRIADHAVMQQMHVTHTGEGKFIRPTEAVDLIASLADKHAESKLVECSFETSEIFGRKQVSPKHLFALYGIARLAGQIATDKVRA